MDEEWIDRDPGWFSYFEEEVNEEIRLPKNKRVTESISLIVETPEYLRKKEQERLEEERRKEEERRELERQKELKRLEEERKLQEEKERQERERIRIQQEEERKRLEEQRKIEEAQKRVNDTVLDEEYWRSIPFLPSSKSVKISKNGKIMQVILTDKGEVADLIPVAMCFNRMRKQLEVDLSDNEKEEKIYAVQELMAIVWLDYTPNKNKRVVLKDGKPLHLTLDNIGFEDIEE